MAWHFSNALLSLPSANLPCSPDRVAESSAGNSSAGRPFAPWKSTPFAPDESSSDKMKDTCHRTQFGQMFVPSTDIPGADLLTWFQGDFLARTFPPPETEQESQEKSPDSGANSHGLFARLDPATSSWKIPHCSLLGDSEPFSETWPKWGTMQNGACYRLPTPSGLLAHRFSITSANESGSSLPTPTKADSQRQGNFGRGEGNPTFAEAVKRLPTANKRDWKDSGATQGNRKSPNLGTIVHRLQPPVADDLVNRAEGKVNSRGEPKLSAQVKRLQTPTVQDGNGRDRHNQHDGSVILSLLGECRRFATVTRSDGAGGPGKAETCQGGENLRTQVASSLNPDWTEWLMGWVIGWTSPDPLPPEAFHNWLNRITANWWKEEPTIPRTVKSYPHRRERISAIGNGQVPTTVALAWTILGPK